jgi:release factor glutamine methyltransferase
MRILTLPGVYRPRSDSWMLADAVCEAVAAPGQAVLDVCTGSGYVALTAAVRRGAEATAVDVSRRAVLGTRINARLNGTRVRALAGDLFAPLEQDATFDLIASNPPYLPTEDDDDALPTRGPARAWDAGLDGRAILDRIVAEAPAHLRPGGSVMLVHSGVCGTERTLDGLRDGGLEPKVVVRLRGPLGPLLGARAEALRERGLLEPGQREADMVIVQGHAPG